MAVDPAGQDFFVYGYCAANPILIVDKDGRVWGYIIGAVVGAYVGGVMSNIGAEGSGGALNPGNWDWENPGTYMGMIQGGISGAMLGNSIETAIIQRPRLITSERIYEDYGMAVDKLPNEDPSHLENLSNKVFQKELSHRNTKIEWGMASNIDEKGFHYKLIKGGKDYVDWSGVNPKDWKYSLHYHPTAGTKPSFALGATEANDYWFARAWRGQGYKGTYGMYNVPDNIFYGFDSYYDMQLHQVQNVFWQMNMR